MAKAQVGVVSEMGLRARAAAAFDRLARRDASRAVVARDNLEVGGKSIAGMRRAAASKAVLLRIRGEGEGTLHWASGRCATARAMRSCSTCNFGVSCGAARSGGPGVMSPLATVPLGVRCSSSA